MLNRIVATVVGAISLVVGLVGILSDSFQTKSTEFLGLIVLNDTVGLALVFVGLVLLIAGLIGALGVYLVSVVNFWVGLVYLGYLALVILSSGGSVVLGKDSNTWTYIVVALVLFLVGTFGDAVENRQVAVVPVTPVV